MTHLSSLDHQSFPHIIDQILSFADPTVLRTFRLTCHEYCDSITARLARHLVLQYDGCLTSHNEILVFILPLDTPSLKITKALENAKILDIRCGIFNIYFKANIFSFLKVLPKLEVTRLYQSLPATRPYTPPCRTVICGSSVYVPHGFERLVLFSTGMFVIGAEDFAPLRVGEIIVICRGGWKEPSAESLGFRVASLILGTYVVPETDCKRVTIVNVEDEEVFMSTIREHAINRTRGARKSDINGIQWRFLTLREYKRLLSNTEKEAIFELG